MKQLNFFQKREFGEIVGFVFQFVRQNFVHYFVTMLLLNLPIVLLLIGGGVLLLQNNQLEQLISAFRFDNEGFILKVLLLLFGFVLVWASYISAITYNYYLLYIAKGGNNFSIQDLFTAALGSMFRLLTANLVLGLIIFFAMVIMLFLAGGLGGLAVLLILVMVVLAINYGVRIAFFQLLVVREKLDVFSAIRRSMNLIKGHWWQTFGLFVIFSIISYLINNIINTILKIFDMNLFDVTLLMEKELPELGIASIVVFAIVQVVTSVISNMFSQTAIFAQYGNLLGEKEGVELKDKVEQIGKTQDNDSEEEDF